MGDKAQPVSARAKPNGNGDGGVNVQVILRCRPASKEELAARTPQVVKCTESAREVSLCLSQQGKSAATSGLERTYHFDRVFPGETSQEKLYLTAVSPIVDEVLEGFNCTIFAYGQTGTGKTYTMQGGDDSSAELSAAAGVIPRAVHQIFTYLDSINSEYTVKCSFLELYNEEITDLLVLGNDTPKVRILEDKSGVVLHGLEEVHVKSATDIFQLLDQGSAKRRTAETLLNKQSSRSHSVFTVTVSIREILAEGEEVIRVGKLYLVDLAGSENISRSGAIDQRAKEAGNINKSLLTLGRVITALVEGQGHVPYRDSKLTRLLRDSLGGKTKTCIIATIAPTVQCQEETLSTLDYAHRAKNIKNKPEVNQKISKTTHLKELNVEIEKLKMELYATREKNGVFLPAKRYEEECEERRQLAARVEFLEQEAERVAEQHESEKQLMARQAEMQRQQYEGQLKKVRGELADTQESLRLARVAIEERDFLIASHQQCEAALAEHATGLTAQLHAAAADISLLFQRVDEKNTLEDGNMALVQEVKTAAVERLAAVEAAVAAVAASQAQRFAEGQTVLQAFVERKKGDTARLQQQMAALQEQLAAVGSTADTAAGALHDAGASSLQAVDALHSQYIAAAKVAAAEAGNAVAAAYDALAQSMQHEQQQLSSFTQQQAAAAEAVYSATQTIVTTLREQLLAAKSQAAATQADAVARLGKQSSAMAEFEERFLAKTKTEQAELMEQIASMLSGFVNKTEEQVKQAVSSLKGQIAVDQQSLEGQLGAMEAAAGASLESLQAKDGAAQAAHAAASSALQQGSAGLGVAMQSTAQQGQSVSSAVQQHATAAAQCLANHADAVAASMQQQVQGLAELRAGEQDKCSRAVAAASEARQAMELDVAAGFAKDEGAAGQLVELTAVGATQLEGFAAEQGAAISGLSGQVQKRIDEEYKADANRDKVPQQRERQLPVAADVDAMRTPPVEEVLMAFREQKAAAEAELGAVEEGDAEVEGAPAVAAEESMPPASGAPTAENSCESLGKQSSDMDQENINQDNVTIADAPQGKGARATSPGHAGHKRSRDLGETPSAKQTPSKLRTAFERHIGRN